MTAPVPARKPARPFFSSGPCAKRPGWTPENLKGAVLGRSHRGKPGKAALKTVLNRFSLDGADPIANLQRVAVGLPEPLNQHVKKLADQTSQVLVIAALRELEKRWDSEIYSFYRDRLAGRYPFKASGEDASLEDFEAFFGGTVGHRMRVDGLRPALEHH